MPVHAVVRWYSRVSPRAVAALDLSVARWWVGARRLGREPYESAVRALSAVVAGVNAEHVLEVAASEDQQPVETFGADGAHEALGVGVRVRCADRLVDHSDAFFIAAFDEVFCSRGSGIARA
jgi:hypothetical protein